MKPDFSKDGLKRFFLYHAEKLILGVSLTLMGVFFWLGFNGEPFKEKSPSDLVGMADSAQRYILSPDSWDQVRTAEARQGELDLVNRIQVGNQEIEVANYPFGFWSIRAKTLSTRKDPQLLPPLELVATHFVAPAIFSPRKLRANAPIDDPLAEFALATAEPIAEAPGLGRGAPGRDEGEGRDRGFLGTGSGGDDSQSRDDDKKKLENQIDAGTSVLAIHSKTLPGVRPLRWQLSNQSEQILLSDVVAVTGLVNIKQLKTNYLESFLEAIGYLPSRDKPQFKFLQVERAEVVAGEEPKWKDISEQIERTQLASPNSLTLMPEANHPTAPEIADPNSFDPILTSPIPAFTQFDYRQLANHPKLKSRTVDPLAVETQADAITDLSAAALPLKEDEEVDTDKEPVRLGSDTSKYLKAINSRQLKNDYKLVRFFDVGNKEPGKTYVYRARVWVSDPNNLATDSDAGLAGMGDRGEGRGGRDERGGAGQPPGGRGLGNIGSMGVGAQGGGGGGGRGSAQGAGTDGPGAGRDRGGPGRPGGGRGGMGRGPGDFGAGGGRGGFAGNDGEEDEDEGYDKTPITPQMKDPEVRFRLSGATQKTDPKDKTKITYFVQEPGYDEPVQVPAGKDELRFCRPSPWSAPVQVEIKQPPRGDVIAGSIEPPRTIRVGSTEISDGEPVIDLVVAPWDRAFRAMLPGRKKAYRGEALDFAANVHVLNPISWLVHRLNNAPIFSQSIMVDMMGGAELPLPRDEVMRHHTASEVLVMRPDGSLKVTNDLQDRTKFKQALLQPDDPSEFGAVKERKTEPDQGLSPRGPGEFPGGRGR